MYVASEYSDAEGKKNIDLEKVGKGVEIGTKALGSITGLIGSLKKKPKTVVRTAPTPKKEDNTIKYLVIGGVSLLAVVLVVVLVKKK
jgi:hypothetical protein